MTSFDPRPDERRNTSFRTDAARDEIDRPAARAPAGRSLGTTIAAILLVIGIVLLGLMLLTPTRRPPVNVGPEGTLTPTPSGTVVTPPPAPTTPTPR